MKITPNQRAKLHCMFRDFSQQLKWAGLEWSEKDWKILILAAQFGQTVGPNPFKHGLLVMNNRRSSSLEVSEANDLLSETRAFGDENGVKWSDPNEPPLE